MRTGLAALPIMAWFGAAPAWAAPANLANDRNARIVKGGGS